MIGYNNLTGSFNMVMISCYIQGRNMQEFIYTMSIRPVTSI